MPFIRLQVSDFNLSKLMEETAGTGASTVLAPVLVLVTSTSVATNPRW